MIVLNQSLAQARAWLATNPPARVEKVDQSSGRTYTTVAPREWIRQGGTALATFNLVLRAREGNLIAFGGGPALVQSYRLSHLYSPDVDEWSRTMAVDADVPLGLAVSWAETRGLAAAIKALLWDTSSDDVPDPAERPSKPEQRGQSQREIQQEARLSRNGNGHAVDRNERPLHPIGPATPIVSKKDGGDWITTGENPGRFGPVKGKPHTVPADASMEEHLGLAVGDGLPATSLEERARLELERTFPATAAALASPCACYHAPEQHGPRGCEFCGPRKPCPWDGKFRPLKNTEDKDATQTASEPSPRDVLAAGAESARPAPVPSKDDALPVSSPLPVASSTADPEGSPASGSAGPPGAVCGYCDAKLSEDEAEGPDGVTEWRCKNAVACEARQKADGLIAEDAPPDEEDRSEEQDCFDDPPGECAWPDDDDHECPLDGGDAEADAGDVDAMEAIEAQEDAGEKARRLGWARCAECDGLLPAGATVCPDAACASNAEPAKCPACGVALHEPGPGCSECGGAVLVSTTNEVALVGKAASSVEARAQADDAVARATAAHNALCTHRGPAFVGCATCHKPKAPWGRSISPEMSMCDHDCPAYASAPWPSQLWPGEACEPGGVVDWDHPVHERSCPSHAHQRIETAVPVGPADLRGQKRAEVLAKSSAKGVVREIVKRGGGVCPSCSGRLNKGDEVEVRGGRRYHVGPCPKVTSEVTGG